MNRLQAEVVDGTYVERSRVSLSEYLEEWLAACRNLRPNTARDYSVSIHKHINPRLGKVRLQSVDRLLIRGLYRKLAESGLSEKTVHNVHICLHKALEDAVADGLLRRNPAERAHGMPKDRPEMKTWSADELAAFLAFTSQDRELVLYHLAAATGMRRGELLGLRWRDVDLDAARLVVRQQFTRQGSPLGFGPPKSKKSVRTIDLDEETVALLREQQERQRFDRHASGSAYRTDLDLVFCRPGGSPEDPNVIGRRFERRVRALGSVPAIALHGLRHTHATLLLEAGVDVKTVSERLGHDRAHTTLELYGHVTTRMRSNAAVRYGSLLSTARKPVAARTAEK
jgi:integrase